jgi:hypothetical protein
MRALFAAAQAGERLVVDAFARYRITDPLKFYQTVGPDGALTAQPTTTANMGASCCSKTHRRDGKQVRFRLLMAFHLKTVKSARPDHSTITVRDRRRSDRITPAMSGVGTFRRLEALHLGSAMGH